MRIGEYIKRTGVSLKTARWLYDNIFVKQSGRCNTNHRVYIESDVDYVLNRKIEKFEELNNVRISKISCDAEYYVTDDGRVFRNSRGFLEELKLELNQGYFRVELYINGKAHHYKVARLVAFAFVPNPDNKPVVNHKDGIKTRDVYTNLEWVTISENTKHAFDTGLAKNDSGFDDSQSRAVAMYSNNGELLNIFGSIREAARKSGYTLGYIANQVRRNRDHGTQGVYFNYFD